MKKYKSAKIIIIALIILILGISNYSRAENETPAVENTSTTEENTPTNQTENTNTNTSTDANTTPEKENEPATEPEQKEEQKQEEQSSENTEEPTQEPEKETNKPQPQVQQQTKKSSNANLGDLGITPNDFKGFKSGTLSYDVTVPNEVEKVNVYAKVASDSKGATITSGTGNQDLKVGKNALNVVVTAEDGTTKTYTINVTREDAKVEDKKEEKKEENTTAAATTTAKPSGDLKKLEVKGYSLTPSFSADVYEYKLNVSKDVNSLDIVAEGLNDKVSIEVVGNTDLQDGENTITVLVKNSETNKNYTYQIVVNKGEQKAENPSVEKGKNFRLLLIGLFVIVVIAILITFIIMKRRQNEDTEFDPPKTRLKNHGKYGFNEDDDDDIDNGDNRLNLDDEKELFKRVNKSEFKSSENRTISPNRENTSTRPTRPNNLEGNTTPRRPENNFAHRRENPESNDISRSKALDDYFNNPNNQRGRHF